MFEVISKITGALDWGEMAGIIAVFSALAGLLYKLFEYFSAVLFRHLRENKQPRIEVQLKVDDGDGVEFVVQTFRPNRNHSKSPYEEYWEKDNNFIVIPEQDIFTVEKSDILQNLLKPSYPYKFFLRIERSKLEKYYARLASSGLIITGRGDEDESNSNLWRVWFLVSSEPQHPKSKDLWRVNHKL